MSVLFTIIIFPLVQIIELAFLFAYRIFDNIGIAILGISVFISLCTLPLYFIAERYQRIEREKQNALAPKTKKIKAVFKGDERHMILAAYYRQNQYHPVYAMRSTFGLFVQIPFFIAAYSFLSHHPILQDETFLRIGDLSKPDGIIPFLGGINLLPLLMTAVNCIAGSIYTKSLRLVDKIQVYGMSLLFLLLLYNSPAGLVLYWTGNNIFSLVKNCLAKTNHAKRIVFVSLCVFALFMDIYALFFHSGALVKRLAVFFVCSSVFIFPFIRRAAQKLYGKICGKIIAENSILTSKKTYIFSLAILFLLAGLIIPSGLIASSTTEFSFLEPYKTPFPFIAGTVIQSAGIFLFWPLCLYLLFSQKVRLTLSALAVLLCETALINTFIFPGKYGYLTVTLSFIDSAASMYDKRAMLFNLAVLVLVSLLVFLFVLGKKKLFYASQYVILVSLLGLGVLNLSAIGREYGILKDSHAGSREKFTPAVTPAYTLSRTGKNVIVIILDKAISAYLPYIFEEKPALYAQFPGFVWYPNCVSFGATTTPGIPPLFGGYEYTPLEINRDDATLWTQKVNDSFFLQFHLFADAGFTVTATDYPFASPVDNPGFRERLKIFPVLRFEQIDGKYTSQWLLQHPDVQVMSIPDVLQNTLIRFSFFRMAPAGLRVFIYDHGYYLSTENMDDKIDVKKRSDNILVKRTIDHYAALDYLPELTEIIFDPRNTYTVLYNQLPHEPAYFQAPDYIPQSLVTGHGGGIAREAHYHVNIAALRLLGKWFEFLRENGVYDNTRIIIVSDHGADISGHLPNTITLPNGQRVQRYNPLFLFKDFNMNNTLVIDNSFMTNADTLFKAIQDIIPDPVNPFTGSPLRQQKTNGVTIATKGSWMPKYKLDAGKNDWLHVRDNIFDPANWKIAGNE